MNSSTAPDSYFLEKLALTYLEIKEYVIKHGFSSEIDWQYESCIEKLDEAVFLREAAWVILNSGMKEKVIAQKFHLITESFYNWKSAKLITNNSRECKDKALKYFRHSSKVNAIIFIARYISLFGFDLFYQQILAEGPSFLNKFPYLGPATSLHLAKNLGLSYAKPDRHLQRIACKLGFNTPQTLCESISVEIDERISVVDIVLWRYATLKKNYLDKFAFGKVSKTTLNLPSI